MYSSHTKLFLICFFLNIFHLVQCKRDQKVILERAEIYCNEKYIVNCTALVLRHNRTSPYKLHVEGWSLVSWDETVMFVFRSYEWKNNQFKESFIHTKVNYCELFKRDPWTIKMYKTYSNIIPKCPVKPGHYYTKDNVVGIMLPIKFPPSKWRVENFYYNIPSKDIMLKIFIDFKVSEVFEYKRGKKKTKS